MRLIVLFLFVLVGFVGCETGEKKEENQKKAENQNSGSGDLFVWEHDGRIYVIGNPKTNDSFQKTKHLTYTKTIPGGGPNDKTVVYEADAKGDALEKRLMEAYSKNPTNGNVLK